jgi:hypothetical protein
VACPITNSILISKDLEWFDVDPHKRAVEIWLQCLALWS